MAENNKNSLQYWNNPPKLKDFQKYNTDEGGDTRAYQEYIAALEQYAQGPNRNDFNTEEDYQKAKEAFDFGTMTGSLLGDIVAGRGGGRDFFLKEIDEAKKQLSKRLESSAGQNEQKKIDEKTQAETEAETKKQIEQDKKESRKDSLANVAIPGIVEEDVFVGGTADNPQVAKRPVEKIFTRDEWMDKWNSMSTAEKERFKADIAGALGGNPNAAAIRSLDPNDPVLAEQWLAYGLYLSESYRENKDAAPRGMTPDSYSKYVEESGSFVAGEEDQTKTYQDIVKFYKANGLPISESAIQKTADKITSGQLDLETWKATQRKLLAKDFPDWADELASGLDLEDLATGYISKVADVLELDANEVDINNSYVKNALQTRMPDGTFTRKTLRELELDLRQDPRWAKTQQAQNEIATVADDVLRTFGFRS